MIGVGGGAGLSKRRDPGTTVAGTLSDSGSWGCLARPTLAVRRPFNRAACASYWSVGGGVPAHLVVQTMRGVMVIFDEVRDGRVDLGDGDVRLAVD